MNRVFIVVLFIVFSLLVSCQKYESKEEVFYSPLIKNVDTTPVEKVIPKREVYVQTRTEPLREELLEILRNEVKDFSSYETHPLDKYVGKWNLMDKFGNALQSRHSIEIFCEDFHHKYYDKFYGTSTRGRVIFTDAGSVLLWPDNMSNYKTLYRLWKPEKTTDGEWAFFISGEGPVGYFVRIDDEDTFLSAWKIENLNGVWISEHASTDGTLWINKERLSLLEELRSTATGLEFDLEQKTVLIPGQGQFMVESVSKEEGDICLVIYSLEDEAQDEPILIKVIPLDFSKAYVIYDQWEKWEDKRFSPEEQWAWRRL